MSSQKTVDRAPPPPGSNPVTVVDKDGNVATILHSCLSMHWSNGLFVEAINICSAGAHFFRVMPKPGHLITAYVAPNMLYKDKKPILASGSPSAGLLQIVLQNTLNILDFVIPIAAEPQPKRICGGALA